MSSKVSDVRHTTIPERATMEEIEAMPALLTTLECASIIGTTALQISKDCARGRYAAVKCGRGWRLNKQKFLEVVGLA